MELAGEFNPQALRRLGHRAVEVVAPEVVEDADRQALERAEREQRQGRSLTWRTDHDGGLLLTGKLTALDGELLTQHLMAVAGSVRTADALGGVETTRPQALADALTLVVGHHASCQGGPAKGGDHTRVVVTLSYEHLVTAVGAATLADSDQLLSAAEARRLACAAGILPMVLGGESQPLDVGRQQRLFTPAQRAALALRDGGCAFPACDRPPSDCETHHITPWHLGGETNLGEGVLLCPHHHHLVEPDPARPPEGNWQITFDARGRPRFSAPARRDGTRSVRQHHRYRL